MIRLSSPLSIVIIAVAVLLGATVGASAAYISSQGDERVTAFSAESKRTGSELQQVQQDLAAAEADRVTNEKARAAAQRRYNSLGSKVDRMLETVSILKSENAGLRQQIDALIPAPNVVGLFDFDAQSAVTSAGLNWSFQTTEGGCSDYVGTYYTDKVFRQYPTAGTRMTSGSYVTLYYLVPYSSTDLYAYDLCTFYTY